MLEVYHQFPGINGASGSSSSATQQVNINIDLTLPTGTTPNGAKALGNSLGEGLGNNSTLRDLINVGGKPNVIIRR